MKKLTIVAVVLLLLIQTVSATVAYTSTDKLNFVILNQDPNPAGPGELIKLRVQIENDGPEQLNDVVVEAQPAYPFSLPIGDEAEVYVGDIAGLTNEKTVHIVEYRVLVDEHSVEGTFPFKMVVKHDTNVESVYEVDLNIQTVDANLGITKISSNPLKLIPGKAGEISIEVTNFADSVMKDVTLDLDFTSALLPLVPIGSSSEQKVEQVLPGKSAVFKYNIMPYADADSQIYKVPLELRYYDEVGSRSNKSDVLAVIVGTEPDLQITVDKTEIYQSGRSGKINFRIANRGVSDVKFLTVTVMPSEDITAFGKDSVYIGGIDSDDFELVEFNVYVERGVKELKVPLLLEYKDANNDGYNQRIDVEVPLYSRAELKKFGPSNGNTAYLVFAIIMIATGAIYLWRKKSKKR